MKLPGREKLAGILLLGCASALVLGLIVQGTIVKPANDLKRQKVQLAGKLKKLKKEQDQYKVADAEVKAAGKRMICGNVDRANGVLGELLNGLIEQVGLSSRAFTRSPIGPNRVGKGGAREVGWTVQGEGELSKVVDLLYLLESASVLNKVDGLRLSAASQPGAVKVGFRYLTLVLEPAPAGVGTNTVETITVGDLNSEERAEYERIVVRDMFRAYVKRPYIPEPPKAEPQSEAKQEEKKAEPPPFRGEIFKAVSLSEWAGKSELHIWNVENGGLAIYQPGDRVEKWVFEMVDYRRMPMPNSILESECRAILSNEEGYWALDRGNTLAQLYRLSEEQLPSELKEKINSKKSE